MNSKIKPVDLVKREARRKALAELGIHTEEQFKKAAQELGPLNIGCFVSPIRVAVEEIPNL